MMRLFKKILPAMLIAAYLISSLSTVFAVERVYILPSTTNVKAPKTNVFQLKGSNEKFILLDNTDEGYFVLSLKYCAIKPFSVNGQPVPYDPENKNSIAYWLNNDFLDSGFLPSVIVENIIEKEYATEGGGSESGFEDVKFRKDYKTTCKVVLLSQTEWSKYNDKFGYADDSSSSFWALRSVRERTGSPLAAAIGSPNSGLTVDGKWTSALGIRPAFYLSKDFFEKASVDVNNTGDTVMSLIRNGHEKAVLSQMYTSSEMYTLTEVDIAPKASNVTITGRAIVGEKVTGTYKFESLDANTENGTMIQWLRSKNGEIWSTILGADQTYYVPTQNDIGYYLKMKVSPMTGSMAGSSYESMPLSNAVRAISKPVASNVRIVTKQPIRPGTILDVKYSYYDENRDICSGTGYIWEASSDKENVEQIGSSRYYKLTNQEAGKYVRVCIAPKKQTNSDDGRKTVFGEPVYTDWIKVENLPVPSEISVSRDADMTVSVSKTDDGIVIQSILTPGDGKTNDKVTAQYDVDASSDYEVVCEWQGALVKNGLFSRLISGTDVLEYAPSGSMWVRAKVYTVNDGKRGKAVYSDPIFIGNRKDSVVKGELNLTKQIEAGKTYEIWISNENSNNSYAYSFKIGGDLNPEIISDKYLIKKSEMSDGRLVIGTMSSGTYSGEISFKAGEIIADKDGVLTISDIKTMAAENDTDACTARVLIVEK